MEASLLSTVDRLNGKMVSSVRAIRIATLIRYTQMAPSLTISNR